MKGKERAGPYLCGLTTKQVTGQDEEPASIAHFYLGPPGDGWKQPELPRSAEAWWQQVAATENMNAASAHMDFGVRVELGHYIHGPSLDDTATRAAAIVDRDANQIAAEHHSKTRQLPCFDRLTGGSEVGPR